MESAFVLGSSEQLGIAFKKRLEHDSGITLKVRGVLNTVTAKCEVQGALSKVGLGATTSRNVPPAGARVGARDGAPSGRRRPPPLPPLPAAVFCATTACQSAPPLRSFSTWASCPRWTPLRPTSQTPACG